MKIYLNENVRKAIKTLNEYGYEAFAVGGCVRDRLRGVEPHDWDVCTNAEPLVILECFKKHRTIETGISHGTVTVLFDGKPIEITTYRIDGDYSDNRRPDSVSFTDRLWEDLSRRDFTINAMAYNETDGLFDFFGGAEDLKNKIIRCIGEPDKRFSEDALRICRALRFASVLGFEIDKCTQESLYNNTSRLDKIARERIGSEFCDMIQGQNMADTLIKHKEIIGGFIPEVYHCTDWDKRCQRAGNAGLYLPLRLAALFEGINIENVCKRLKLPGAVVREAMLLSEYIDFTDNTRSGVKRLLNKVGENAALHILAEDTETLDSILKSGECYCLGQLAVNGNDLINIGLDGKRVGDTLLRLLEMVIDGEVQNEKEALLSCIYYPAP